MSSAMSLRSHARARERDSIMMTASPFAIHKVDAYRGIPEAPTISSRSYTRLYPSHPSLSSFKIGLCTHRRSLVESTDPGKFTSQNDNDRMCVVQPSIRTVSIALLILLLPHMESQTGIFYLSNSPLQAQNFGPSSLKSSPLESMVTQKIGT